MDNNSTTKQFTFSCQTDRGVKRMRIIADDVRYAGLRVATMLNAAGYGCTEVRLVASETAPVAA